MLSKTITNKFILFFVSSLLCLSSMAVAGTPITVEVVVTEKIAKDYLNFLEKKQKKAIELIYTDMPDANRGIIRLVILEQALHKSGITTNIEFVISPNSKRAQVMVQTGEALITIRLLVDDLTPKGTLKSSVSISQSRQLRGIYGLKSNHALMKVKTLEELIKFSAVINTAWLGGVKVLQEIGPTSLSLVNSRDSIFNLIAHRNIDFTLLGLHRNNNKFHQSIGDITLVPIPDLLIQTNDSLHFLVSKKHENSQVIFEALERGLAIMRQQGLIKKYYQQGYQFLEELEQWNIINKTTITE